MPIEDIDFLKQNSKVESFICFIDSSKRDKRLCPTPSEYTVEFTEPFHNVIGLEILDSSVPRASYIIDSYNNTLYYTIRYNCVSYNKTVIFENQDYNFETMIDGLTTNLTFDVGTTTVAITPFSLSTPNTRKSIIYYESKYPFYFDFTDCQIAETLGFDEYGNEKYSTYYKYINERKFGCILKTEVENITDLITTSNVGTLYQEGTFNTDSSSYYVSIYKNNSSLQIFNKVINSTDFNDYSRSINYITTYIGFNNLNNTTGTEYDFTNLNIQWEIRKFDTETQTFDVILLNGNINDTTDNITIEKLNTIGTTTNPMYKITIALNNDIYNNIEYKGEDGSVALCLLLHETTLIDNIGGLIWYNYNKYVSATITEKAYSITWNNNYDLSLHRYNVEPLLTINSLTKFFCLEINSSYKNYKLQPTGRVLLLGERFIILRCPEIESQFSSSYGYGSNSPGLALFKLGVLGLAEARFDFASITHTEFHPIGKLTRLHFRFENPKGQLYDFKGLNHNLLIVIKYLKPSIDKNNQIFNYSLNNNYNPNFIEYKKYNNEIIETYSTDDEEQRYIERNFNKVYLEKERQYIDSDDEIIS